MLIAAQISLIVVMSVGFTYRFTLVSKVLIDIRAKTRIVSQMLHIYAPMGVFVARELMN